jgi:hypothetical protein
VLHELPAEGAYRALITHDGLLESAFLLGRREHDRRVRKLIAGGARLTGNPARVFAADARPEEFLPSPSC